MSKFFFSLFTIEMFFKRGFEIIVISTPLKFQTFFCEFPIGRIKQRFYR